MPDKKSLKKTETTLFILKTAVLYFFLYDVVFMGVPASYSTRKLCFLVFLVWAFILIVFGRVKKELFEYDTFRNAVIALTLITAVSVPYTMFRARFYEVLGTDGVEYPHAVFFIIYSIIAPFLCAIVFKTREEFKKSVMYITLFQSVIALVSYRLMPLRSLFALIIDDSSANIRFGDTTRAVMPGASGSAASVLLAFGAMVIGEYIVEQAGQLRKVPLGWAAFGITLAAEFFCGRTGFYISLLNLILIVVRILSGTEEPGKTWRIVGISVGAFTLLFGLWYGFFGRHIYLFRERLRHAFNLSVEFGSSKYSFWSKFTGGEVPPLSLEVAFGLGIFKGTTNNGLTIAHDSGYIRRFVAEGIPLAILEYVLLAWVLILLLKQAETLQIRLYYTFFVAALFVIEIKEPFIYKYMPVFLLMSAGLVERCYYLEDDKPVFNVRHRQTSAGVNIALAFKKLKRAVKYPFKIHDNAKNIKELIAQENRNLKNKFLTLDDRQRWTRAFLGFNRYKPEEALIIAEHFLKENVRLLKSSYDTSSIPADEPILLCNVRDDLEKIKNVISHHRKMGVKYFGILDNGSTDGTLEYLMSEDIDVFTVEEQYTSVVRAAWITKIAAYYGFDRWFVVVDSDELLVYPGGTKGTVHEIISDLKEKGLSRGLGMMVDMYARETNLNKNTYNTAIIKSHRFFDVDSYKRKRYTFCAGIYGGPRARMFPSRKKEAPELLTKYPVIFWRKGEIYRYHYVYPFEENFSSPLCLALLHYKFGEGELEKLKRIVDEGNYAGGSSLYKRYISALPENGRISFLTKSSEELTSPQDLLKIDIMERLK